MDLKKCIGQLSKIEITLAVLFFIIIIVVVTIQITFRYFLANPFIWVEELSNLLLVSIVFLGSSVAFKEGKHASMDYFKNKLTSHSRIFVNFLTYFLFGILFIILLFLTKNYIGVQSRSTTPALHIPRWYYSLPLLWCNISMLISLVSDIIMIMTNPKE